MPDLSRDTSSSWAESIRAYESSKKTLAWKDEDFVPVQKISILDRMMQQREVDPLSMTYRDPKREQARLDQRDVNNEAKRQSYISSRASQRNILVNVSNPTQVQQYETLRNSLAQPANIGRDRHIISHLQVGQDHMRCPTIYDEQYMNQKVHVRTRRQLDEGEVDPKGRDYNILSNQYHKNDKARKTEEFEATRSYIIKKFSETRDLDPVKMRYYDTEKEDACQSRLKMMAETKKEKKLESLPQSIKYSEGNSYNIINPGTVVDGTGLKQVERKEQLRMNRSKKIATEARQRNAGLNDFERGEERRMERVKYDRFRYQLERGYNPINLTTELPVPLYGAAPPTMWQRLQKSEATDGFTGLGTLSFPVSAAKAAPTAGIHGPNLSQSLQSLPTPSENFSSTAIDLTDKDALGNTQKRTVRDLSGRIGTYIAREVMDVSNSQYERGLANVVALPRLDLSVASRAEKVTYDDNTPGPVVKVRTGGFQSHR